MCAEEEEKQAQDIKNNKRKEQEHGQEKEQLEAQEYCNERLTTITITAYERQVH